ncbi:MAG: sigma-E factor negative regulatory protein [Pseudoxanthomonas sp.]
MTTDKIDNHYFQQLSALMDGDLPPDQARFLLRRMQHDTELTGCWERWQLCGDALRGQSQAPAPAGFADRIAAAIAAEPLSSAANTASPRARSNLAKWGGGALAASVAAIALFMVRQQVPDETPSQAAPAVANQSPVAAPSAASPDPALQTAATVTAASVAVASVPRRQNDARRSATRSQQAARNAAATRNAPERAVASAAAVPVVNALARAPAGIGNNGTRVNDPRDSFSNVQINTPAARPWPRAVLPQYSSGSGAFNADYSTDRAAQTFYPFEPRLPVSPPVTVPETAPRDR